MFFMSVKNERFVDFSPLELNDVTFKNQDGLIKGISNAKVNKSGTVYIYVANLNGHVSFQISKVSFLKNSGRQFGTCVLAIIGFESDISYPKAQIILESVTALNNELEYKESYSDIGLFTFENVNNVIINGTCNHPSLFNGNKRSIIYAHNSNIYLNGYVTFSFNRAMFGAALNMKDSYLQFNDDLNMTLKNNCAQVFGGAIHIINSYITDIPRCALQILSRHKITSINNTAGFGGNIVYGYPIYHCSSKKRNNLIENVSYYSKFFDLNDLDILSIPHSLNNYYCGSNSLNVYNHYPGETIHLSFSALDYAHNSVYTLVEVSLMKDEKAEELVRAKSSFLNSEKVQVLSEHKTSLCSVINITVFYHDRLGIWGEANSTLFVRLLSHQFNIMATLKLNITHCPPGFKLDHSRGVCKCSSAIKRLFTSFGRSGGECDINTLTISMPPNLFSPWIGIYSDSGNIYAQVASICTLRYCMSNGHFSSIIFDERSRTFLLKNSSNLSKTKSFCRPHRKGVVCGECEEGYSVWFIRLYEMFELVVAYNCFLCSSWAYCNISYVFTEANTS